MRQVRRDTLKMMYHADGTNWTPRSVAERTGYKRVYVKNEMYEMCENGALASFSRGLYRVPA